MADYWQKLYSELSRSPRSAEAFRGRRSIQTTYYDVDSSSIQTNRGGGTNYRLRQNAPVGDLEFAGAQGARQFNPRNVGLRRDWSGRQLKFPRLSSRGNRLSNFDILNDLGPQPKTDVAEPTAQEQYSQMWAGLANNSRAESLWGRAWSQAPQAPTAQQTYQNSWTKLAEEAKAQGVWDQTWESSKPKTSLPPPTGAPATGRNVPKLPGGARELQSGEAGAPEFPPPTGKPVRRPAGRPATPADTTGVPFPPPKAPRQKVIKPKTPPPGYESPVPVGEPAEGENVNPAPAPSVPLTELGNPTTSAQSGRITTEKDRGSIAEETTKEVEKMKTTGKSSKAPKTLTKSLTKSTTKPLTKGRKSEEDDGPRTPKRKGKKSK